MALKICLFLFILLMFLYELYSLYLVWVQRKKPLPECVSNIYSEEHYSKFIAYKKEYRKINILSSCLTFVILSFYIFSNFFSLFDSSNIYITFLKTLFITTFIDCATDIPIQYYATFVIEEKYGLNKRTKREFIREAFLGIVSNLLIVSLVFLFLIYVGTHLSIWTHNFSISYLDSGILVLLLMGCFFVLAIFVALLSFGALRLQYHFIELEPGFLRTTIERYLKDCKKKVHHIKVYNESKKSNSKNAFLLKIGFYREFGIADNFLDGNSDDELLAVLLHEIGHLKHKKNIWNYLNYGIICACLLFFVWLLPNGDIVQNWILQINGCFHLSNTNPYLLYFVFSICMRPISFFFSLFNNFISRNEEKEADYNSVDHGYGQALINTFTKISQDELIDVNPHPWIEFLEYDHPGMATRIQYIQSRMETYNDRN